MCSITIPDTLESSEESSTPSWSDDVMLFRFDEHDENDMLDGEDFLNVPDQLVEKFFVVVEDLEDKRFFVTIEDQDSEMFLQRDGYHVDDQTQEEIVEHKKDQYENGIKEL